MNNMCVERYSTHYRNVYPSYIISIISVFQQWKKVNVQLENVT